MGVSSVFLLGIHPVEYFFLFFCCHSLLPSSNNCAVQNAFVKTSISVPSDILTWVKSRAVEEGNLPVSRVITQALREKIARETKPKTKTKGVKKP